ncbi:MAG: LacI family DNA-binding transcriptional regulator [Roseburia sp.]
MTKAVKLADIAVKLGVSTVTVSKALSGQKGVSEPMRER